MDSPEFGIFELNVGGGVLALCPLPVGHMDMVHDWAPDLVLSLVEEEEMPAGLWDGYRWLHMPVVDYETPRDGIWDDTEALAVLRSGGRVLVHCKGGCGRSGMAVLRLMLAAGEGEALARLRAVRPCAIETDAQLAWALSGTEREAAS